MRILRVIQILKTVMIAVPWFTRGVLYTVEFGNSSLSGSLFEGTFFLIIIAALFCLFVCLLVLCLSLFFFTLLAFFVAVDTLS